MIVTIFVTDDRIRRGIGGDSRHCPVGLAIREQVGDVNVKYAEDEDFETVLNFIQRFDTGLSVTPITFNVKL